jgi:glyoxylase-like metal-dependent hydrolase (beta-lactamase superfamily II)
MRAILLTLALAACATAPSENTGGFADIAAWRALVADDADLPREARVEIVKRDTVPFAAAHDGGAADRPFVMARSAFQLCGAEGCAVIDAGYDAELARRGRPSAVDTFDAAAWARVQNALSNARVVAVTHEHPDHIAGLVRHADPATVTDTLILTTAQHAGLAQYAPEGAPLSPALANHTPIALEAAQRIGPGLVMIPAAGHTPGSVMFYQRMANGREILFIGDIAWAMANVEENRSRPEATLARMVTPDDRVAVLAQIAALHAFHAANPEVVIVPSHDDALIARLVEEGVLAREFR